MLHSLLLAEGSNYRHRRTLATAALSLSQRGANEHPPVGLRGFRLFVSTARLITSVQYCCSMPHTYATVTNHT